jgi:hypothetical protein
MKRLPLLALPLLGLLAWTAIAARGAEPAADAKARQDADVAEVRRLIERYFRTWSAQDIERYGQCFMPQAVVQQVDGEALMTSSLSPFLKGQAAAHKNSPHPMTETPEHIDVRLEASLARAVVEWKLVAGDRVETGYDHFTLMRYQGQWRIANLIFYADQVARSGQDPSTHPADKVE